CARMYREKLFRLAVDHIVVCKKGQPFDGLYTDSNFEKANQGLLKK
ncbi:hypothetical protein M153_6290005018, partial [Pseudoloma neurophilia]